MFPGQGSQTPADRDIVARQAPDLLALCVDLLGCDPFARADESTRFAQPAVFCASVALWRAAEVDPDEVVAFAGHSLGEIAALVAAGALAESDALRLVVLRGSLMAAAAGRGGMLALRAGAVLAQEVAQVSGAVLANDNAPGQVVLAGDRQALVRAAVAAEARGVRARLLPVTGAFHSPAMAPAAAPFARALRDVEVHEPSAPVLCCATAEPFTDPRAQLAAALTAPVRWREVVLALRDAGARRFCDVGPGRVLDGLVRRTLGHEEAHVRVA
jgi:[acyl-carrier-protein] S-malonyltransferase